MKKEYLTRKRVVTFFSIIIVLIILVFIYEKYIRLIMIDGNYSISDEKFKISLKSQMSKDIEVLNLIDENTGIYKTDSLIDSDNTKNKKIDSKTALIVYKDKNKGTSLSILVLKKGKNYWKEIENISNIGNSYEEIGLIDMDGDDEPEIVLGLGEPNSSNNSIIVYKKEEKKYLKKLNEKYDKIFIDEFDRSKGKILVTLKKEQDNKILSLNLFAMFNDGKLRKDRYEVGNIEDKLSVNLGRLNDKDKGLIIQKELEDKNSEIQIYNIKNFKFKNIQINGMKTLKNSYYIEFKDKNGNGIVDIPIQKKTYSSTNDESKGLSINYWTEFDEKFNLKTVLKEFNSEENKFTFKIPNSWGERIDVKIKRQEDTDKNSIIFDEYDENDNYKNKIVIGIYSLQEWYRKIPKDEDNIIFKSEKKVYILESSSGEEDTDISSVKANFKVLYNN